MLHTFKSLLSSPSTGALTGAAIVYSSVRLSYRIGPQYVLEINKDPAHPDTAQLNFIYRLLPSIERFKHTSLKCLQDRGYEITVTDHSASRHDLKHYTLPPTEGSWIQSRPSRPLAYNKPIELLRIRKKSASDSEKFIDIDELLIHCKECQVHTVAHRIEEPKWGSKDLLPSQHIDRHDWHKCYVERKSLW
jgi:hypothetical protein